MKNAAVGLVVAIGLFGVGAICWSQAQLTRRMAEAHRRLATLHYDAEDNVGEANRVWNRLPWPAGSSEADLGRYRTTVAYWLSQYDSLTDLTLITGAQALTDPQMLLVTANASWRVVPPPSADRRVTIERLDAVIQAYADVLRKDPATADAAFNYEFVSRVRDMLAKAPPRRPARETPGDGSPQLVSVDLPSGPTVHGLPGGPPEGTEMSEFKTIAPMQYEEREQQVDPGRGVVIKRKG